MLEVEIEAAKAKVAMQIWQWAMGLLIGQCGGVTLDTSSGERGRRETVNNGFKIQNKCKIYFMYYTQLFNIDSGVTFRDVVQVILGYIVKRYGSIATILRSPSNNSHHESQSAHMYVQF